MEKEVLAKLAEFEEIEETEQLIKDNKKEFTHSGILYKVTRPTLKDKEEIRRMRLRKTLELRSNPAVLTRAQVIEAYRGTDDDISRIDQQMIFIRQQMDEISARAFKQESNEPAVAMLEEKFNELKEKFVQLSIHKTDLLDGCLESELNLFCIDYLTYLVLQKKDESGSWVKVFKNFDEYRNVSDTDTEILLERASSYANQLISLNVF